jgi:hypothetical protein
MPEEKRENERKPQQRPTSPNQGEKAESQPHKKKDHRKFHHKKKPKNPSAQNPPTHPVPSQETTKPAAQPSTVVSERAGNNHKTTERKEQKKPNEKRSPNINMSEKPIDLAKRNVGIEIGEPKNTTDWLKDDIGRYHRAVLSALDKSPISPEGVLDLSEIWISTSLPLDLIIEVIKTMGIEPNQNAIKEIVFQGEKIWVCPKPVEKNID